MRENAEITKYNCSIYGLTILCAATDRLKSVLTD